MDMRNKRNVQQIIGIIAFAILCMAAVWNIGTVLSFLKTLLGIVSFFIVGFCFAYLLNAPMFFVENKLFPFIDKRLGKRWQKLRRPVGVLLVLLLVNFFLFFVIFQIIPELGKTFSLLGEQLPGFIEEINSWLNGIAEKSGSSLDLLNMPRLDWEKIGDAALEMFRNGAGNFLQGTVVFASSFFSFVVTLVVGLVVSIYMLLQKEKLTHQFKQVLYAYLPEKHANESIRIGAIANDIFRSFIGGQFTEAMILGGLCLLGMHFLKFPFALSVSALVAVTAFIPIVGGFLGVVIGSFMIVINQGIGRALGFILFFTILQQIEGNFIYPHVVGKRVKLPGLWVLTAVTVGGNIAGVFGMMVSVPFCSLLFTLLREAVHRRNQQRLV